MARTRFLPTLMFLVTSAHAQTSTTKMIDVGGHLVSVQIAGTAKPGVPIVVFESGLGTPASTWGAVQSDIATTTRTVTYDRAGIGGSPPDSAPRTIKRIVTELHTMLGKVDASGPYVLVGHSYGGAIIHMFAALFPKEVAGLVYVDAADFMQTNADIEALWAKLGVKDGREISRKLFSQMLAGVPAGTLAEYREVDRVERGGYTEFREAGNAPDVPTVVLLAGKSDVIPQTGAMPFDPERYFQAALDQRIDHFSRLTRRGTKNTLVVTTRSGHFIHGSEPELVSWGIRNVVNAVTMRPDLERFVGQYPLAPSFVMTITRDGDKLFLQATAQPAFLLTPESATIYAIKIVDAKIEFEVDATGKATALVLVQNGARQRAPKNEVTEKSVIPTLSEASLGMTMLFISALFR